MQKKSHFSWMVYGMAALPSRSNAMYKGFVFFINERTNELNCDVTNEPPG